MGGLGFALKHRLERQHGGSKKAEQSEGRYFPVVHSSRPEKTNAASAK